VAETLLRAREELGNDVPDLNRVELYRQCRADLLRLKDSGVDVSDELHGLESFRKSFGLGTTVRMGLASCRQAASRSRLGPLLRRITHRFRPPAVGITMQPESVTIRGDDSGFSNIYECAQRLPELRRQWSL
jgi:hypothetical protein